VLFHPDATSLCRAVQVSRTWRAHADDDVLWHGIYEQHIGTRCHKYGWGLPVLEKRRTVFCINSFAPASPAPSGTASPPSLSTAPLLAKRAAEVHPHDHDEDHHQAKRLQAAPSEPSQPCASASTSTSPNAIAGPSSRPTSPADPATTLGNLNATLEGRVLRAPDDQAQLVPRRLQARHQRDGPHAARVGLAHGPLRAHARGSHG
jgi:hypothetical protein